MRIAFGTVAAALLATTVAGLQTAWTTSVGTQILLTAPLVVGDETIINAFPSTVAAYSTSTGDLRWSFAVPSGR